MWQLLIVIWNLAIVIEIFTFKKNKELPKLIIPFLFTLFFVLARFGDMSLVYYAYVILSWILYFVHYFRNKK